MIQAAPLPAQPSPAQSENCEFRPSLRGRQALLAGWCCSHCVKSILGSNCLETQAGCSEDSQGHSQALHVWRSSCPFIPKAYSDQLPGAGLQCGHRASGWSKLLPSLEGSPSTKASSLHRLRQHPSFHVWWFWVINIIVASVILCFVVLDDGCYSLLLS